MKNLKDLQLAELRDCNGIGRNVLEARITYLCGLVERKDRDATQLNDNLTSVQTRCTELLNELRAYRGSGICLPGWWCHCGAFNGSARAVLTRCRCCDDPRPR